jgi:tRNA A37 threonylcarbamoyladenosine modification protein TsaB
MDKDGKTLIVQTAVPSEFAGVFDGHTQTFTWQTLEGKNLEALCKVDVPDPLSALAVAVGPGRFSSTRVGVGFVLGLAMARHIPVAALDVFDLMDDGREGWLLIFSRKNEYYASFRAGYKELDRTVLERIPENTIRLVDKEHPLNTSDLERFFKRTSGSLPFSKDWQMLRVQYMKEVEEEYKLWR